MRLTEVQQRSIHRIVKSFLGEETVVSVFGSRLDNQLEGGDVDLLIEASVSVPLMQRAALKIDLEAALSLPVDLLFIEPGSPHSAFQALAKARSRPLIENA